MDSLTTDSASVPDESVKPNNDNTNLTDPAKLVQDYFAIKREYDHPKTPLIIEMILSAIINSEMERFHAMIDHMVNFDSTTNKLNSNKFHQIYDGITTLQGKERSKLLSKEQLTDILIAKSVVDLAAINYDNIMGEIEEFKFKEIPQFVLKIKTLQEKGLFTDTVLVNSVETLERGIQLGGDRHGILKKMDAINVAIDKLITNTNDSKNLSENESISSVKVIRHNKETTTNKESKISICRSEHNTPFCKNCGWKTSWLKNFKKRGVSVKINEDSNSTSKHFWNINVHTE